MLLVHPLSYAIAVLGLLCGQSQGFQNETTYINPVMPGWHSDPSCIQVDGTYFCVISTFIAFPGLPVYASKDLVNWKLASHAYSRDEQLPGVSWATEGQQQGIYAATIRYHEGEYYVICHYVDAPGGMLGVLFKTSDPFDDDSWSDPVTYRPPGTIDPDLFWDDDGTVWMASHTVIIQTLDIDTGDLGEPINIWNGTGGVWPEGPHVYKKDGWYYLMIAEGGTGSDHSITIARAETILGPYESYENNPILTNRGTDEYLQAIGHGDLFQGPDGNWWGLCLGIRDGPDGVQPMGRESFLFNVSWPEGEWPSLQPVRGRMPGSLLPPENLDVPGDGAFIQDPDDYEFEEGSKIPSHFMTWRVPRDNTFSIGESGLEIVPSRNNLTGIPWSKDQIELSGQRGLAFLARRQTHTLFSYSVDLSFDPQEEGQEAGVSIFRTQVDHIDLGVVRTSSGAGLSLRFRAVNDQGSIELPAENIVPVPESWEDAKIRLQIDTINATHYELSASPAGDDDARIVVGQASALLVSGGNGTFVGSLLGAYATCNGAGSGVDCPEGGVARFTRWKYDGISQQISHDEFYPEI